ncbi:hypothetical protein N0V88_006608 [Collariella sp. IMI 366227]|nr:hypothetical protein N0V88_006608 [Collariella sp. IMI 366227]
MEQMLAMAYPELRFETVEDGMSGSTVKHGFQNRINAQFLRPYKKKKKRGVEEEEEEEERFDWAVVLGGTNDIGMGFPPEEIFESLKQVWDIALLHKCKVLALTVPECGVKGKIRERIDAQRNILNDLIKNHKAEGFHVYDLHASIPYFSMSAKDRERYWDDHLHFTPDGYDMIGNKVGIALVTAEEEEDIQGDDTKFEEEEDGDPSLIEQGWVVVRKKDLE